MLWHSCGAGNPGPGFGCVAPDVDVCRLPKPATPQCSYEQATATRYWYDAATDACEPLDDDVCPGSLNIFQTRADCEALCWISDAGVIAKDAGIAPDSGTVPDASVVPPDAG
jgi:hypothetical protein